MDASAIFRIIGDALSIISLSLIYSSTLNAWKRIPKDAKIPMQWDKEGKPTWRAAKTVGLLFVPIMATVVIFVPTILGTTRNAVEPMQIVVVFAVRAVTASAFCIANLYFLRAVHKSLVEDGILKD